MPSVASVTPLLPRGPGQVMKWTGLPACAIQGGYSGDLLALLASMLHTDPGARPSAGQVEQDCTAERQEPPLTRRSTPTYVK